MSQECGNEEKRFVPWENLTKEQQTIWLKTESEFAQKQKRRLAYQDPKDPYR